MPHLTSLAPAALAAAIHLASAVVAAAQPAGAPPPPSAASGVRLVSAARQERLGPFHLRYSGGVEVELAAEGTRLSADAVDVHLDRHRLIAEGNVVFATRTSRIAADRAEVDTEAQTGMFTHAFGSASVPETVDRSFFGTQEPDAFFYGATIEKLGPDRYRVRRGGFTTCVQPTPRWEMTAGTVTLTVDRRAMLRHAILKVKDVPLFYVPAIYYPINKEDRATGFLLPVYGTSELRGPSIGNAFFWAIDRSQDLTLLHDWFTSAGQGYGAEYRYAAAGASGGEVRAYRLQQRETAAGSGVAPAIDSLDVRGAMSQGLPAGFRARVNVDYAGDMLARRLTHQDLLSATTPTRGFQANVSGAVGRGNTLSATAALQETFSGTRSWLTGTRPRVQLTRALTRIGRLPIYAAATAEAASLVREDRVDGAVDDRGLSRMHASPSLQMPLAPWPFLSMRSSIAWHATWWSESLAAGRQVGQPFFRSYADLRTTIAGPALSRVWNTPESGYAERLKHVVEPEVSIERTTAFDGRERIVPLEGGDYVYGGTTRVTYGVTNRVLARRRTAPAAGAGQAREILSVQLQQSYYSDPLASTVDGDYSGGFSNRPPSDRSPLALTARATPFDAVQGSLRLEYDTDQKFLETVQASATVARGRTWSTTAGWTGRRYVENVLEPGVREPDGFFNAGTRVTLAGGRAGGRWEIDWNARERRLVQHRIGGFYHAQCCGVGLEYQAFDYGAATVLPVRRDRRINLSITLAGLGTASNLLGALGLGQGGR